MRESRYTITELWQRRYADPEARRLRESHRLALSLSPFMKRRGVRTILDVGCGTGFLLRTFNLHGFTVAGTEVSQDLIRTMPDLNIFPCPINEMGTTFIDEQFDFVLSVDVLDHVSRRDAVTGAKEMVRIAQKGFAAVINGDPTDQQLLESPDLWVRIFEDLIGEEDGRVELKQSKDGAAMIVGWK